MEQTEEAVCPIPVGAVWGIPFLWLLVEVFLKHS